MANFNFNKVILGGRLTADAELKMTTSQKQTTSFTVAINRKFSQNNEVDFINCIAWGKTAETISKYFHKGSNICVVGAVQTRSWTDRDGNKKFVTEILVEDVTFIDSKNETNGIQAENSHEAPYQQQNYTEQKIQPKFEEISEDDDLPF